MRDEYNEKDFPRTPRFCVEKKYIVIEYGQRVGFADLKSNVIIPVREYEWVICGDDFLFIKPYDEDWKVYEFLYGTIVEVDYDDIRYEEDEFVAIKLHGKWEFEDLTDDEFEDEFDDEFKDEE